MSPTPLIELQRRLAEAGRIRMGEKTEKGAPKRLTTWRITSPDESLIAQAAGLYGGKPEPWESPSGPQFEVVTTTSELPVLVMPGYSFRQGYEYRTSPTNVERRCDGIEMDDGQPCLCNASGEDKCALLTRLTVALPELTTMLGWRLETKGDNAARELLASMDLVRGISGGAPFVPAKLRIVERRSSKDGQAVRFVVPVIDVQVRYAELLDGKRAELPAGYTPLQAIGSGVSLAEGLETAETQALTRSSRSAAPIPAAEALKFAGAPMPESEAPSAPRESGGDSNPSGASDNLRPTKRQTDKLNVLVGKLREAGALRTWQVWQQVAQWRGIKDDPEMVAGQILCDLLGGRDDEGALRWGPLRDNLTREEASALIEWLSELEAKTPAGAAA